MGFDTLNEMKSLEYLFRRLLLEYYKNNPTTYKKLGAAIGIGHNTIHKFLNHGSKLASARLVKVVKFLEKHDCWDPSWGIKEATKFYNEGSL